mgnify:CR=1 FL=1
MFLIHVVEYLCQSKDRNGGLTMGFTTPVFILKNTPELRDKLVRLGYKIGYERYINDDFLATDNDEMFGIDVPYPPEQCNGYIHCGTNEALFLAIAALRDDTDDSQWFVYPPENIWFICDDDDINYARENSYDFLGDIDRIGMDAYKQGEEDAKKRAIEILASVLENWVHGGDADCIIAEFEEELMKK